MTIFVGGSMHGKAWQPPTPPAVPVSATGGQIIEAAAKPPPSYVDTTSGDQYSLLQVAYSVPHPITGKPTAAWANTVYMHAGLMGTPQAGPGMADAVTRWWFTTTGTPSPSPEADGHRDTPLAMLLAGCRDCAEERAFASLRERAQWMSDHLVQGHDVSWADTEPTTEGVTDGGPDQGHLQEG
jgi:hypothetical protein